MPQSRAIEREIFQYAHKPRARERRHTGRVPGAAAMDDALLDSLDHEILPAFVVASVRTGRPDFPVTLCRRRLYVPRRVFTGWMLLQDPAAAELAPHRTLVPKSRVVIRIVSVLASAQPPQAGLFQQRGSQIGLFADARCLIRSTQRKQGSGATSLPCVDKRTPDVSVDAK